jgi:dTDP-4-dehydrorhamnose reductase
VASKSRKKYLIVGREGQLARAFIERFESGFFEFLAPKESELDISQASAVDSVFSAYRPDVVINCAAYNLVDKAQQEEQTALAVNAYGPQNLARIASKYGSKLVHYGSDYVFDGSKEEGLYCEDDSPRPLSKYGESKLLGEQLVERDSDGHLILRLSWVFGDGKQNFIDKVVSWSKSQAYLRISCDEVSVPTSTRTVVDITLLALEHGLSGLYHLTNRGYCSRFEWARFVLDTLGIDKFIRPVSMNAFNLPAKRPGFSAMSHARLAGSLGITISTWQEAVAAFLRDQRK